MAISKDAKGLEMSWEPDYGYAQAVKVGDTIYVSGQLSHDDEGNIVGEAPLDEEGRISDHSNMETQMRQTYANAKKILAKYTVRRWTTLWTKSSTLPTWTLRLRSQEQ